MLRYTVKLYQAMLRVAPKGFNTIDMLSAMSKFIITMTHSEMLREAHINQPLITAPSISMDDALNRDMSSDNLL
ncbi:Uncharacterised protein [Neisseria zoodegmatis]|uniref:Uncharacterized protein n=1 Tax=Neisseria zoodegmatis TaxID=326523 RepID=A0AB38DP36_9NEIS|nr:Uncharacterised protein [Neisseria zoodegmatis]